MITKLTAEELISFEDDIASAFNSGQIKAPVHLYSGNEEEMIEIFQRIKPEDWVLCSWRSHYQCLLKGVPKEEVKQAILEGKSITLTFPNNNILSSAIVGGIIPIALGVALGIKIGNGLEMVYCFLGEMTAETGIFHEARKYAVNHKLPIHWIIEDNSKSVCTNTEEVWGGKTDWLNKPDITYYQYNTKYPHAGAGQRVQF